MELILEEFLWEKRLNIKKIREKRDFFVAKRRRLKKIKKKTARDLKKKQHIINKDIITKIIYEIREAKDILINGYI